MSDDKNKKPYVVKVCDEYTVMINVGAEHGANKGDVYSIYEIGEEILDPNTGISLGNLEIPKGLGEITNVQKKMSMLKSTIKKTKKVKRIPNRIMNLYNLSGEMGAITEEVEEEQPFDDPKVNDTAVKLR